MKNSDSSSYEVSRYVQRVSQPLIVSFKTVKYAECWADTLHCLTYCSFLIIIYLIASHLTEMLETPSQFQIILSVLQTFASYSYTIAWLLLGFSHALLDQFTSFSNIQSSIFTSVYLDVFLSAIITLISRPLSPKDNSYDLSIANFLWTLGNGVFGCHIQIDAFKLKPWNFSSHFACVYLQILCFCRFLMPYFDNSYLTVLLFLVVI